MPVTDACPLSSERHRKEGHGGRRGFGVAITRDRKSNVLFFGRLLGRFRLNVGAFANLASFAASVTCAAGITPCTTSISMLECSCHLGPPRRSKKNSPASRFTFSFRAFSTSQSNASATTSFSFGRPRAISAPKFSTTSFSESTPPTSGFSKHAAISAVVRPRPEARFDGAAQIFGRE